VRPLPSARAASCCWSGGVHGAAGWAVDLHTVPGVRGPIPSDARASPLPPRRATVLQADAERLEADAKALTGSEGLAPDAEGSELQRVLARVAGAAADGKLAYNKFFAIGLFRWAHARGSCRWGVSRSTESAGAAASWQRGGQAQRAAHRTVRPAYMARPLLLFSPQVLPSLTLPSCACRLLELTGAKEPAALERLVKVRRGAGPCSHALPCTPMHSHALKYQGIPMRLHAVPGIPMHPHAIPYSRMQPHATPCRPMHLCADAPHTAHHTHTSTAGLRL
jgi:hypothetical protein